MRESKVYFIEVDNYRDIERVKSSFKKLLKESNLLDVIKRNALVAVKLSFGEKNNKGHIHPHIVRSLIKAIRARGGKPFLTDTNVIYRGRRMNAVDHLETAYLHGFNQASLDCPVIIADGVLGENVKEIRINQSHFQVVKIAGMCLYLDYLISLAHFTGHLLTGFAGTIKNIGMGLASRAGKLQQHSNIKPKVIAKNCTFCKGCIRICPVGAIIEKEKVVFIQEQICMGCGDCLVACKFDAIEVSYSEAVEILGEKMVEYAYGVLLNIKYKIFVNFLLRITKECDCLAKDEPSIVKDIGILASVDPLALDKASIDLILEQTHGKDIFRHLHPDSAFYQSQLQYAQQIGLGTLAYELIRI